MKKIFDNILKAIKNHNKIYSVMTFWALWLFVVVNHFAGTDMALITFFIGFCISLCLGAYITDNPNEKEQKLMNKWIEWLKEGE